MSWSSQEEIISIDKQVPHKKWTFATFLFSLSAFLISLATLVIFIIFFVQWQHDRNHQATRIYKELPWFTMKDVHKYDTFLFDIDGTLITGSGFIEGGRDFIHHLHKINKSVLIVTNVDWSSPADKAKSLSLPGIDASRVVLPIVVMIDKLGSAFKGKKVLALAPDYVLNALAGAGATLLSNNFNHTHGKSPDADDIMATINVKFYILSTDTMYFGRYDLTMADGGSISEAFRLLSRRNATIFGKPSTAMNEYLANNYNLGKAIIFGDNLNTDMITANGVGMDGCLMINHGVSSEDDWKKYWQQGDTTRQPTYKGEFSRLISTIQ